MQFNPLAFIELFVVLAFVIAWGILELVAHRLDRKRQQRPPNDDGRSSASETEAET